MRQALDLAARAEQSGEVPVGALLVSDGQIIGSGYNQPIQSSDATAHAEVVALREAGSAMGNYRFPGSTLYVTVEPCMMCAGALVHARVQTLVYGASEPKAGAVSHGLLQLPQLNHRVDVVGGVLAAECGQRIRQFFAAKRAMA